MSGHGTSRSKLCVCWWPGAVPLRCSPVCRSEQRVVAADQFLPARAAHSQLCRDPRPVQTCTLWPAWRYSIVTGDHVRTPRGDTMRCPGLRSSATVAVLAALLPLAAAHWTQAASHQPLASESYLSDSQSAGQCPRPRVLSLIIRWNVKVKTMKHIGHSDNWQLTSNGHIAINGHQLVTCR